MKTIVLSVIAGLNLAVFVSSNGWISWCALIVFALLITHCVLSQQKFWRDFDALMADVRKFKR